MIAVSMAKPRTIRVYADTSVFGGVFDAEFEEPSRAFFNAVNALHGYREIAIYSPLEVIEYED